jgi:purine-binding chemotaxis protein CheW
MAEAQQTTEHTIREADRREGKYLTFSLCGEEYGIVILKIKEIIGLMNITSVPQTPDYVKGVINLRGKVIPVVDLRLRFGMEAEDYTERTCIIVVEIKKETAVMMVGVVVDSVSEVLSIANEDVDNTPMFGANVNTQYILGMAKMDGGVKILIDINKVFTEEEISALNQVD